MKRMIGLCSSPNSHLTGSRVTSAMIALFLVLWAGGEARLMAHPVTMVAGVRLRLVQPDVPQREEEQSRYWARDWQRLFDLSVSPGNPTTRFNAYSDRRSSSTTTSPRARSAEIRVARTHVPGSNVGDMLFPLTTEILPSRFLPAATPIKAAKIAVVRER